MLPTTVALHLRGFYPGIKEAIVNNIKSEHQLSQRHMYKFYSHMIEDVSKLHFKIVHVLVIEQFHCLVLNQPECFGSANLLVPNINVVE